MNTKADMASTFECFGKCGKMLEWWRDGQRLCPDCSEWQYETLAGLAHGVLHTWEEYVACVRSGFCWILQEGDYKQSRSVLSRRGQGGAWGLGYEFDRTPCSVVLVKE